MEGQLANVFSFMMQEVTVMGVCDFCSHLLLCYFLLIANSFQFFVSSLTQQTRHYLSLSFAQLRYINFPLLDNNNVKFCRDFVPHSCLSTNCQLVKCELTTGGAKIYYNGKTQMKYRHSLQQSENDTMWNQLAYSGAFLQCLSLGQEPTCYARFEGRCVH